MQRAHWMELNQNRPHARKWVRFENICPKFEVLPHTENRQPINQLFSTTSQLNGNFNGLYLWKKTRYWQSGKGVGNYSGSPTRLKIPWTLVHKLLKIEPEFLPTLRRFCIPLHCQVSHIEVTKWNSNFVKRKEVNCADVNEIKWHRIVGVNETIEIRSLVSRAPKDFKLAMASHRSPLSGNTSLIATVSSISI